MPPPLATPLRTRVASSAATRRAILAAAEHLLATRGEDGLSIRELCARAGVTAPTVYHHFGDKQALVERVVNDCFSAFDRALTRRPPPRDPVEALRWGLDRYLDYGLRHPTHYRLMFQRRAVRPAPAGLAAYDRLRQTVAAVDAVGRLSAPVEDAAAACWAAVHGVTSLAIAGYLSRKAAAITLVQEAIVTQLVTGAPPPPRRQGGAPR